MARRYAADTSVSVEKSRAEIEITLSRYGASRFAYMTAPEGAMIAFEANNRRVRFTLPLPDRTAREFTHVKRYSQVVARKPDDAAKVWEQACRSRWRALALAIKAKLESVAVGITTFEDEFLSHIVMPGGGTVGENIRPQIAAIYRGEDVPLLPPPVTKP